MTRLLALAALGLALLGGVLVANALRLHSRQLDVAPLAPAPVDAQAVAARLAGGLRHRTVSHQSRESLEPEAFLALHRYIAASYPVLHAALRRESVGDLSLLYTWQGSDPSLPVGVLCAHLDVVPVEAGTEAQWSHPPFGGEVADGFVWGRGAMDDKGPLFGILEAVEALAAEGFRPRRTFYLAFGHDEEVGGGEGARAIAELLGSRGVRADFVLDEGGAIARGAIPGLDRPLGLVGIAEKGSVSIGLSVDVKGGHSSVPPRQTAVGILARGIDRLERNPMPAGVRGVTRTFVAFLGPELPFHYRLVLANLWLFAPLLETFASADASFDAMLRTTTAPTLFHAGVKENVLPSRARAAVNFRIAPEDSSAGVALHVRRILDDDRIALEVGVRNPPREPTAASPVDGEAFALIQRTVGEIFPGAVVAPYLVLGGTDARHYASLSENLYRISPVVGARDDLTRIHGTDERIGVEALADVVRFYRRLLESAGR